MAVADIGLPFGYLSTKTARNSKETIRLKNKKSTMKEETKKLENEVKLMEDLAAKMGIIM